ncbi:MAG: transporter substrate-binding protein [Frankiales bacterium]|jgi:peptide/nickel transport system substrate-binding protein|nr:transporter substrate-binding protein [Frankiales bacterium]
MAARARCWRSVSIGLTLALSVAACGSGGDTGSTGKGGGKLTIALADEPSTLDPQAALDGNERAVTDNVYDTLLRRDPKSNDLTPNLATALPTQLNPTTWQFKLRSDVKFTNGEVFDAAAAAFSVKRVMDPKYTTAQRDFYGDITDATAVDATTLNVITKSPDPILPARMYAMKMMPPKASLEKSIIEQPIGTGPYMMASPWQRGQQITLKPNPDYWGTKPSIESVVIRFIPEAGSRASGVKTGEVDLAAVMPAEQTGGLPQVLSREGLEFPMMRLKNYEGPLKDARVRQALNYAVDKEAIAKNLYSGYASVAKCQTLSTAHFGYDASLEAYPYDPAKAKALLAEAGYKGEAVTLLGPTGRWLKDAEFNEAVMGYLQAVGIKIKADIRPFSSYLNSLTLPIGGGKQPDMAMVSASNELFDATKIATFYSSSGGLTSYKNAKVDADLAKAGSTADPTQREAAFHDALATGCTEDPTLLFTVNLKDIYGAGKRLAWEPRLDGSLYLPDMKVA